jgi:PAS domain S-box-containing protein
MKQMLLNNLSIRTLFSALRSASSFDPEIGKERLQQNILRFVIVKLLLTVMGLAFYIPILSPRLDLVGYLCVLVSVDWLFIVPYYHFAARDLPTAIRLTQIWLGITSATMTFGLYLAGGFMHPLVLIYFGLVPLALIVISSPRMAWVVASLATLSYTVLVALQVVGLIPSIPAIPASPWSWILFAGAVVLGLWIEAGLMSIYSMNYETRRREVERRAYAESIWSTVGKTVISTQDLDQVLTTVIQIINEKMRVETGSILLREPAADTIKFAKILHGDIEELASVRLKVGQGVVGWVVETGQSALVPDVSRDPRWYNKIDQGTGFVTRSILCVPLITHNEVIGAIELLNKHGGEFTHADLQLLESIAAPVAIAIQNARLHQRIVAQLSYMTEMFHQVEHAKKEWETTVDAIDAGIVLTDEAGRILRVNHTLARWSKSTSRAMVGKLCWRAVHNQLEPPEYCPHCRMLSGEKQFRESEIEDTYLGGIFRATSFPLHDPSGKFVGTVSVLKNITEEKRLQAQLIQSEKLAATGRLAASLAHEINNPLQGIQGCLDLVQVTPNGLEQEQFLAMARKEVSRLGTLIKSMLELSRPSQGKATLLNITNLVEEVLILSTPSIQKNGIQIETRWDTEIPVIIGAADQIKQVFLNLVLNAIESMPDGGKLKICGQVLEQEDWLTVDVSDSGAGIPADILPHLFEPFFTTKTRGTGLGLSISESILTTHGGRLTVESQLDTGTIFTVWLPIPTTPGIALSSLVDEEELEE